MKRFLMIIQSTKNELAMLLLVLTTICTNVSANGLKENNFRIVLWETRTYTISGYWDINFYEDGLIKEMKFYSRTYPVIDIPINELRSINGMSLIESYKVLRTTEGVRVGFYSMEDERTEEFLKFYEIENGYHLFSYSKPERYREILFIDDESGFTYRGENNPIYQYVKHSHFAKLSYYNSENECLYFFDDGIITQMILKRDGIEIPSDISYSDGKYWVEAYWSNDRNYEPMMIFEIYPSTISFSEHAIILNSFIIPRDESLWWLPFFTISTICP